MNSGNHLDSDKQWSWRHIGWETAPLPTPERYRAQKRGKFTPDNEKIVRVRDLKRELGKVGALPVLLERQAPKEEGLVQVAVQFRTVKGLLTVVLVSDP